MTIDVKICGVRRPEDLDLCVELGVQLVGFNFWPQSKRYLEPRVAAALVGRLPPAIRSVGVFVNAPVEEVSAIARSLALSMVQLHGDERPDDYAAVPAEVIQVVRVSDAASLSSANRSTVAARVLLDSSGAGFGGTGTAFDWKLVTEGKRRFGADLLLAGGLTPQNVAEAVTRARPGGVDVASGVESSPGVKDPAKLRAFVEQVRRAAQALEAGAR